MRKKYILLIGVLLSLFSQSVGAQSFTVSGTVRSGSDSQALAGVTVFIRGTGRASQTGADGRFEIAVSKKEVIGFSHVGYQTRTITVTAASSGWDILLQPEQGLLNEVVVTALGISKQKKSLGYALQELKS